MVQKHAKQPWRGIAMDAKARPRMALPVGERSRQRATALGTHLPLVSRAQATFLIFCPILHMPFHRAK
jgi:hypothetical protein